MSYKAELEKFSNGWKLLKVQSYINIFIWEWESNSGFNALCEWFKCLEIPMHKSVTDYL